MDINYAIAFMSNDWIIANLFSLLYIIIILCIGKFLNKENREKFAIYFVYVFIVIYAIYHIIHVAEGTWSLNKRLPFHLCGFSSVITCFIFLMKTVLFDIVSYIFTIFSLYSTPSRRGPTAADG